jgi:hypothetical protein
MNNLDSMLERNKEFLKSLSRQRRFAMKTNDTILYAERVDVSEFPEVLFPGFRSSTLLDYHVSRIFSGNHLRGFVAELMKVYAVKQGFSLA